MLLVDGDPAKIQAARALFPNVIIVMCLKHLQDNFASRGHKGGAWKRSEGGGAEGLEPLEQRFAYTCEGCGAEMPPESAEGARCATCMVAGDVPEHGGGLLGGLRAMGAAVGAAVGIVQSEIATTFKRAMDSSIRWNMAWKELRQSTTLPECKRRLDLLAEYHPSVTDYVKYLWRNVGSWALCTFVWKTTFGYQSTSMQEGIFSCLKRPVEEKFVPLHQMPDHVHDSMTKAETNHWKKKTSELSLFNEAEKLRNLSVAGCDTLIEKCREYLTREGYALMLDQLSLGVTGYEVQRVALADATDLCKKMMRERNVRAASASQFLRLLLEVSQRHDTYTFKVTARTGNDNPYDIVLVSDNGSFACTEPYFAQMGMPGRHILAVYASKYCAINVFHHFHPIYLRKLSDPPEGSRRQSREIAALQVQDKLTLGLAEPANFRGARPGYTAPAIARSTSWSWAIERVRPRMLREIIGEEHANYLDQQAQPMPAAAAEPGPAAGAGAGQARGGRGRGQKRAADNEADGAAAASAPKARLFTASNGKKVAQPRLNVKKGKKSKRHRPMIEILRKKASSRKV